MRPAPAQEAEYRQLLREAGVSDDTIELVVRSRVARAREAAAHDAEVLTEAVRILANLDSLAGTAVSERHRWGRGGVITETDLDGSFRVLETAAGVQQATAAGDQAHDDEIRSIAISGLAYSVAKGDTQALALRIEIAERWAARTDNPDNEEN